MRKIFSFLAISLILISCTNNELRFIKPTNAGTAEAIRSTSYAKSKKTGLCFSILRSHVSGYQVVSSSCIPCDSLKRAGVVWEEIDDTEEKK